MHFNITLTDCLLQLRKGNKDPSPVVQISIQDTTKESKVWQTVNMFVLKQIQQKRSIKYLPPLPPPILPSPADVLWD